MKKLILVLVIIFALQSCTQNQRAKNFGGTIKVELPTNKKLITATWKNDELWYLVRERRENETKETYEFFEDSSFGVMEGKVVFIEK